MENHKWGKAVETVGTTEFARMVGVTPRTVQYWAKSGRIKALRSLTGRLAFTKEHYLQAINPPAAKIEKVK